MDRKHVIFTVIALIAAAGCSSTGTSGSVVTPTRAPASPASASALSSAPNCNSQFASWRNGALSEIEAIYTDLSKLHTADRSLASDLSSRANPSADESAVRTAAASVQADVQAVNADLPPSCVPHYRQDLHSALTDISRAAKSSRARRQ